MKEQPKYPMVSLLIPCFNEAAFIEGIVTDIINQNYPIDKMEVFFIDGGSTDTTKDFLEKISKQYPYIYLLKNPEQYVPQAMNLGIQKSKGELIIRLDAHGAYPSNYVERLVYWQQKTEAENVGGVWITKPRSAGTKAKAIAGILAHPFGVGNSQFRLGVDKPTEVDTVPFGCYPRWVFEKYGLYDSRLIRNQDIELNKRIRRMGGRVLLVPEISSVYYARDHFRGLWQNNYQTGRWVPLSINYTKSWDALSLRHFVPLFFVGYLSLLILAFFVLPKTVALLFAAPIGFYFLLIFWASFSISRKAKSLGVFLFSLIGFPILHLAYGLGTFQGFLEVFLSIFKNPSNA